MKFIKTTNMSRLEWLKLRTQGIGGSDVSAIMGQNPWRSAYRVWTEKTGRVALSDKDDNEFIEWGNTMEPIIANKFEKATDKKVFRPNKEFIHPKYDFLRANIDRDVEKEPGFVEIKTVHEFKSSEWDGDQVPAPYLFQVQHYMNVLNRPYVYFAYLIGGHHFDYKRVDKDQYFIDSFTPYLIEWWRDYVEKDVEPPVDGSESTTNTLKEIYSEENGEIIELPGELNRELETRQTLKNYQKDVSSQVSAIDNDLRRLIGNASMAKNDKYQITNNANKNGNRTLRIKELN